MRQPVEFGDDRNGKGRSDDDLRLGVVFDKVAVNVGLEVDNRLEAAATDAFSRQFREEVLDRVQPRSGGAVNWKVQRGCRASRTRTLGCLWVA